MKTTLTLIAICASSILFAQVQINKPIQLTGGTGERIITNLETPVNGTDAVNKDYVDAAVAASGGSKMTMISNESSTTMNLGDAIRYCKNLNEGGYTDWTLPTFEELFDVLSTGGNTVSNDASANDIWIQPMAAGASNQVFYFFRLSTGYFYNNDSYGTYSLRTRCVR